MEFSQRLKMLLEEKNVTWKIVSEELGIGKNQQKYWEDKDSTPDGKTLIKLCTYFGVTSDFLLGIDSMKEKSITLLTDPEITLSADEKWFILKLRELDKEGRTIVESAVVSELRRMDKLKENIGVG